MSYRTPRARCRGVAFVGTPPSLVVALALEPGARAFAAHCLLVEAVPGKVSGVWVLKGTRMPAQIIVDNYKSCMDPQTVEVIVAFAADYRAEARNRILASPEFAALLDGASAPPPVDWRECGVVAWMAGPAHNTWVLRGTPTPADMPMRHHDDGWRLEDIAEHYGWDEALIAALGAFGEAYRAGVGEGSRTRA